MFLTTDGLALCYLRKAVCDMIKIKVVIAMMGPGYYGMFSFFPLLFFILWVGVVAYLLVLLTRMSKSLERIANKMEQVDIKKVE